MTSEVLCECGPPSEDPTSQKWWVTFLFILTIVVITILAAIGGLAVVAWVVFAL